LDYDDAADGVAPNLFPAACGKTLSNPNGTASPFVVCAAEQGSTDRITKRPT
jgi:hypothetical protein